MPTLDTSVVTDFNEILVATDFSPASETALLYAFGIARRNRAKVYMVHVIGENFLTSDTQQRALDDAWREAHRVITDHYIAGRLDGIENKVLVKAGGIWETIEEMIDQYGIDLLVLGTRGRSRLGKLLLGSVAETIFRQAVCPVMTVGPKAAAEIPSEGPRRILFATGFSAHSLQAGGYALWLAQRLNAELVLLHVHTAEASPQERTGIERAAQERLQSLVPSDASISGGPKCLVEFGSAAERILAVANEQRPDLIVLGIRKPTSFVRRLRWATAYEVVSNAPCPVLTVRSPETS